MSSMGSGEAFRIEQERKRKEENARQTAWRTSRRKERQVWIDKAAEKEPPPMSDPFPEEFHGKDIFDLGSYEKMVLNTSKMVGFKEIALIALDRVMDFWTWRNLKSYLGWPVNRSNVLRLLTNLEWRVRKKVMEAEANNTWETDPFCLLMSDVLEATNRFPCRGPGRPGRIAGVSPQRKHARPSLDDVMPEVIDDA